MSETSYLEMKKAQLEALKTEVETRVLRAKDEDDKIDIELFRLRNPDIHESLGDWLSKQTEKVRRIMEEIGEEIPEYVEENDLAEPEPERKPWPVRVWSWIFFG